VSTIVDHGYIPEEHAPDPVIGHGDPTPPGKIAIWLFLASEVMFFIGLLGTYIILRSAQPKLFADHAHVLSQTLAGVNTLVLIFSSLTMALAVDAAHKGLRNRTVLFLGITFLCACGFMAIKAIEYADKYHHYTVVAPQGTTVYAYDGHMVDHDATGKPVPDGTLMIHGYRMEVTTATFDAHLISEHEMKQMAGKDAKMEYWPIDAGTITQKMWYGPWKNNFFAAYFTLTGVHGLHVVCGMIPIFILMVQALRGRVMGPAVEYTGLYWHLVDLIWIFLFPLLYLI
jgi:cytochrome c oxidase subunit 3